MPMRMWACLAVALAACSGQATTEEVPEPSAPAEVEAMPSSGPEADLLAKTVEAPPPGPNARLLEKVAEHYQVGLARCPLIGSGRVRQIYGTSRDQLTIFGPSWEMEWDPAEAPPWDPAFDETVSEGDWVTLLVVPGQTRAWIATRKDTYAYTFPPAVAGQTVTCTAVHTTKPRVVRGVIKGELAEENVVVPCRRDMPQVASDNTFVTEIPTPCSMWVEGGPFRSQKIRVDEGTEPLDAEFTLARDPLLQDNRFWTAAGNAKVEEAMTNVEARQKETAALLDRLATLFAGEDLIESNIKRHRYELQTNEHKINQTRIGMEEVRQGKIPVLEQPSGAGH